MSKEKQIDCIHYDKELDCCKELSDWSGPMPVLQPCVEGACPKYKSGKQLEEMAEVYNKARLKARDTLGSMNEGEEMWYSKAYYEAGYRKQSEGEWIVTKTEYGWNCAEYPIEYTCSVCGRIEKYAEPYCPNCGARMSGGQNEQCQ